MPTFLEIKMSPRKDKKLLFKMDNPKQTFHFGSKASQTYVEGASKEKRLNYIKRHKPRENWDEITLDYETYFLVSFFGKFLIFGRLAILIIYS